MNLVHAAEFQRLFYAARGVHLFKAQLRVGMQVAAKGREFGVERADLCKRTATRVQTWFFQGCQHQCPLAWPRRRRGSTAKYNRSTTRLITTKIKAIKHR